ncbi:MAG: 2'-5' RNA ligase family protein [Bacillota bacterium]|nr:2'-5' RNA ligase family protein [Bacillota bacterium]
MEYAIILSFDQSNDRKLRQMIKALADTSGNETVLLSGLKPHLTLAEFDTDRYETVVLTLSEMAEKILSPIPVKLASAGFFPNNLSVLYLAPIVDEHLLDLHRLINNALEPLCTAFSPLYREENWVPHCTLALELDQVSFADACTALAESFQTLDTVADQIGLIACCPYCEQAAFPLGSKTSDVTTPTEVAATTASTDIEDGSNSNA